jgi:hypothetical protein
MPRKKITIAQYKKIMDKIIQSEEGLSIQDKFIKMLDEASKYIIQDRKQIKKRRKNQNRGQ